MINNVAAYILDKVTMDPELVRGTNFFAGYAPDLTATSSQGVIVVLRQLPSTYDAEFPSQSHADFSFNLQFLGPTYFSTEAYAISLCTQIRNVHGARIQSNDPDYVYHCANLAVSHPTHLTIDQKGRFAFVASLVFMCQRIPSGIEGS